MKHPFRSHILPLFTMGAGGIGLALRLWLFSAADEKGLLPLRHIADPVIFILTALVFVALFLATRELKPRHIAKKTLRLCAAGAYLLGGLGLTVNGLMSISAANARLTLLATVAGILGGLSMLYMAALKYWGKRLPYWLPAILTVVLLLDTVAQCQIWGSEPQLQVYVFPLMASVFLMLTAYYKTAFVANQSNGKRLAFFSQCALFLCCLSLNCPQWPLYFGMLFWSAVQFFPCIRMKKEA